MKKTLNLCLLAFFTLLLLGCSKSTDPQPEPPEPSANKISIPIRASYTGDINVFDNQLKLTVSGEVDLLYYIPPGKDTTIILTESQSASRKGKSATLTMSCQATNNQGLPIPICYNHAGGEYAVSSLQINNQKIEWNGQICGTSGDQVVLRVRATFQYEYPGDYIVHDQGIWLYVTGEADICWVIPAEKDTSIIINGIEATRRLGKPFRLRFTCNAFDQWGYFAAICYNYENGIYNGTALLADNPKVEWVGHHCY